MAGLPHFMHDDRSLSREEAFENWRGLMKPMFQIRPTHPRQVPPRGWLSAFLLADITAGRCFFSAQHLVREPSLADATPDHLVLRLYLKGGFTGEFAGRPVRVSRGNVAICDLRRPLNVRATASDTLGLVIPRTLLDGVHLARLPPRLDRARERLLAARLSALHRDLPRLDAADAAATTTDLLSALRRLFDPSASIDALEGPEFDADLFTLAEREIAASLGSGGLSPTAIAERLQVSRATLYRAFEPVGGVMQHVFAMRLDAVRAALEQPSETRTVTRLASVYGFSDLSHLSRSFKSRYGVAPSEWRERQIARARAMLRDDPKRVQTWWRKLGRGNGVEATG